MMKQKGGDLPASDGPFDCGLPVFVHSGLGHLIDDLYRVLLPVEGQRVHQESAVVNTVVWRGLSRLNDVALDATCESRIWTVESR